jgi:hypothetical protein
VEKVQQFVVLFQNVNMLPGKNVIFAEEQIIKVQKIITEKIITEKIITEKIITEKIIPIKILHN